VEFALALIKECLCYTKFVLSCFNKNKILQLLKFSVCVTGNDDSLDLESSDNYRASMSLSDKEISYAKART